MNSSSLKTTKPSPEIVAEAAAWITRLHSSRRSPEVEAGLRSWLAANEHHALAFEDMTEIWDSMPAIPAAEMPRVAAWEKRTPSRARALAAAAVIVCAVVGLATYALTRAPAYVTDIGEQRIVNLEDGTRVSLNSDTRMAVEYGEAERRIVLRDGEAFFEVARQAKRPFVVFAGDHRVTALGTSFAVRYDDNQTAVSLVEGKVAVTSSEPTSAPPVTLVPGQRLTFAKHAAPKLDEPRMEAVTAWRRGEVILDETVLADAVAEMNRYDKTSLVIDTPAIAALPVSGIYRTGDSPGFAHVVAQMYDLEVVENNGRIYLRR